MKNSSRLRPNCSNPSSVNAFSLKWIGLLAALFIVPALGGCENYGLDEATVDQQQFNEAFKKSDVASMAAAAARFDEGFRADKLKRAGASYCFQDVLSGLEFEARRVQKAAISWVEDKSESNVLRIWDEVEEQEDKLANRTRDCQSGETGDLEHLNTLINLVRADIKESFDLDALREADDTRRAELSAERLANCDLDEWQRKLLFQHFVRLEDIYGLEGRKKVIKEVADFMEVSEDCVDRTARNATYDNPEWIPERM
jgi:hypothetical protein